MDLRGCGVFNISQYAVTGNARKETKIEDGDVVITSGNLNLADRTEVILRARERKEDGLRKGDRHDCTQFDSPAHCRDDVPDCIDRHRVYLFQVYTGVADAGHRHPADYGAGVLSRSVGARGGCRSGGPVAQPVDAGGRAEGHPQRIEDGRGFHLHGVRAGEAIST